MSNGFALSKGFLPLLVDPWPELNNATPSVQLHYRALSPNTGCSAPALRFGTLILMGTSHLDFSLRIGAQVPTFRARAQLSFTPPSCRMSSGQQSGRPPDLSRVNDFSPVSTSSIRFRHVISGLLALVSLSHTSRDQVPPFPQRSPPRLLTDAACGGLKPAPDGRLRRTYLHLSHSSAPSCVGAFVAHSRPHNEQSDVPDAPTRGRVRRARGYLAVAKEDLLAEFLPRWG